MTAQSVLKLDKVSRAFGAVVVADALTLDMPQGQALGIIGPNGAGKTSMFNLINGVLKPDAGQVNFQGKNVTGLSAAKRAQLGMARSFQIPQPFGMMTVFENCMTAATQAAKLPSKTAQDLCLSVLEQTGLIDKANMAAGKLSLLERKRLELARALCCQPKLLLLDEIAGGLTEAECRSLVATIQSIKEQGASIIWIEHVVHALLAVVERLIVIDFGKLIADGDPHEVMASDEVKRIYLGIDAHA